MADTSVSIVGNCTRDPETRFTQSGMCVASFGVAVSARKKNEATGQWEDGEASFFDVTAFGRLAENVAESVAKGRRVVVAGALKQSSWEKDGQKRSKVEVVADDVGVSLKWDPIESGSSAVPAKRVSVDEEPF